MSINKLNRGNSTPRITGRYCAGASALIVPGGVIISPAPDEQTDYRFNGSAPVIFSFNPTGPTGSDVGKGYIPTHESKVIGEFTRSKVDIIVVGGGGGTIPHPGASPPGYSGGGGAGGVVYFQDGYILTEGTDVYEYTVTIGGGGPVAPYPQPVGYTGINGQSSSFVGPGYNLVSRGGGGGARFGNPGGSGGGASYPPSTPVGEGTQPAQSQTYISGTITQYGNPGGPSFPFTGFPGGYHSSSGGGGAGGSSSYPGSPLAAGTPGGPGVTLLGVTVGGGGGGAGSPDGSGGPGGGGNGNGSTNTGGGGAGRGYSGGSGLVIVRVGGVPL